MQNLRRPATAPARRVAGQRQSSLASRSRVVSVARRHATSSRRSLQPLAALPDDPWSSKFSAPGSARPSPFGSRKDQEHSHGQTAGRVQAVRDFDGKFGTSSSSRPQTPPEPTFEELIAELSPEERKTVRLFHENSPSVVNVNTSVNVQLGFPFNMMVMDPSGLSVPRGVGSGFIWDTKGHVITNCHVIDGASEVKVTLSDQTVHTAKVIGKDREKDIAVLQLDMPATEMAKLRPVTLGFSSRLLVGQKVLAIGNPFGLDQTLTQGIISGLGRQIPSRRGGSVGISNVIQTDAAINPGNSGGPLLDMQGRLIGINTAIIDPTGVGISSGVGFAIPIDPVKGMVDQILTHGRVLRPVLGISLGAAPQRMRSAESGRSEGVLVLAVTPGGPAAAAGVQGVRLEIPFGNVVLGDVIIGFNGKPIKEQRDLFAALDNCTVGETVELKLTRNGTTRTVQVTLADRKFTAASE